MRGIVDWIGAQADVPDPGDVLKAGPLGMGDQTIIRKGLPEEVLWQSFPAPNFPAQLNAPTGGQLQDEPSDRNPDLWMYRRRTVSLLRRYMRFSLETGRLPSFVGREFFRAKVTSYRATTF